MLIEKLTPEQESRIQPWLKEWFAIGSSTEPADRPRAESAITGIYSLKGKKRPHFIWTLSLQEAKKVLKENGKEKNVSDFMVGQENAYWVNYYLFCSEVIGVKYKDENVKLLQLWNDITQSCSWWWPFENVVVISDRPKIISWNEKKVLHSTKGMSVMFRDGTGIYNLNGVLVNEKIVMHPEKLTKEEILGEKNVDIRREMIRQIGIDRFSALTNPRIIDKQGDYELLSIDLSDTLKDCRYLKMKNLSIGVFHIEGVEKECSTVQEAINWRAGDIKKTWKPSQLT